MFMFALLACLQPATPTPPAAPKLHPLITEVLYAVPKEHGDADQDGMRSATGDEFIELVNPHDKPINLKGYTLSNGKSPETSKPTPTPAPTPEKADKGKEKKKDTTAPGHRPEESRIHFTFPELTLQPGEVVVVFNGYESHTPGPVGDSKAAAAKNEKFHNAYVFSMHVTSQYMSLANAGDCVLLCDPEGKGVECVTWGESDRKPEKAAAVTHKAPDSRGSVQRTSISGEFVKHQELPAPFGDLACSPGWFEVGSGKSEGGK
jgi:hypothetical protein